MIPIPSSLHSFFLPPTAEVISREVQCHPLLELTFIQHRYPSLGRQHKLRATCRPLRASRRGIDCTTASVSPVCLATRPVRCSLTLRSHILDRPCSMFPVVEQGVIVVFEAASPCSSHFMLSAPRICGRWNGQRTYSRQRTWRLGGKSRPIGTPSGFAASSVRRCLSSVVAAIQPCWISAASAAHFFTVGESPFV